jgi:phosphinothricin acetyltransferase
MDYAILFGDSVLMHIRAATSEDAVQIAAIYADNVLNGTGTFEEVVPSPEEMSARMDKVIGAGWPWLVAEEEGRILGYAYAAQFRDRSAYRYCCEDSVYIHPGSKGSGVGTRLLERLIDDCARFGFTTMLAVIGDSANGGSIALHRKFGFTDVGTMAAVGYKFDRWLDVVTMQRRLTA